MENTRKKQVIDSYMNGNSFAYIKKKFKISEKTVYKFLKEEQIDVSLRKKKPKRPPKHNLVGQKFSHLLVKRMEITDKSKDRSYRSICICDCGREADVNTNYLMRGLAKTCGDKDCKYHRQDYTNSGNKNIRFTGHEEISGMKWASYRLGAERRGFDFDISVEYAWKLFLAQGRKCTLSNEEIYFGKTNTSESTASLDRTDSSKGYIEGNVMWVHKSINYMKMDLDVEDFIYFCKKVAENN